jgi:hypothetical protein
MLMAAFLYLAELAAPDLPATPELTLLDALLVQHLFLVAVLALVVVDSRYDVDPSSGRLIIILTKSRFVNHDRKGRSWAARPSQLS